MASHVFFFFFLQISRLTWFTRFDPVPCKEQVFSVELSTTTSEEMTSQPNHMGVRGTEEEDRSGKAGHDRKGGSTVLFFFSCPVAILAAELVLPLPDSSFSASGAQTQSRLMSALYWLCGMERKKEEDNNPVTPPPPEQASCSLEEKPCQKLIININLIICLAITAFIIGYWA